MTAKLTLAIVTIVSALLFYTAGVWGERLTGRLKPWHLLLFLFGLICDTTGTTLMGEIAGKMELNIHGMTGALAIVLMLVHALWASGVLIVNREKALLRFHKFSMTVWLIWLVPFLSGMVGAMKR
jgi:uncharacterized repeat protein (TIGR03987 family)